MTSKRVFGMEMTSRPIAQLVDELMRVRDAGAGARLVFTMNLDHVVRLRADPEFRKAYSNAATVTADGFPVYVYARLKGAEVSRISGADLMAMVLDQSKPSLHRCFFLVPDRVTGEKIAAKLASRGFDHSAVRYAVPEYGFEQDGQASLALAQSIGRFAPTHLFVCVGAPKSEVWSSRHASMLGDASVLCAGAAAEFYAGTRVRAPVVVQYVGLEWLWRWAHEPRRLFHRYFVSSWGFIAAMKDDLASVRNERR